MDEPQGRYVIWNKPVKFKELESRMVIVRGWGEWGGEELLFNGYRVLVLQKEKVQEIHCITMWI
jgi:nitrogen fixation protein